MAESAFNFNQAPGAGGARQFGKALAAPLMVAKSVFGNKDKGGMTARDQSALMRQQMAHNIDTAVVKHVIGETAADAAHKRSQSAARTTHRLGQKTADAAHQRDIAKLNTQQQLHHETIDYTAGALAAHANGRQMKSISLPGGSATFGDKSTPTAGGVGSDTSGQAAVSLD